MNLYREKIDTLQAAEERLLSQRTAAQNAAAEQVRQAEKDGAALIAAAPEMYEGLKEIRDVMEKDGRFCRTVEAIDKLLKKARGEE